MVRSELERLSRKELIDLVLRLQRPAKMSQTSSKPPSGDRKERRENAKPGGAKPGHQGHSRILAETPSSVVDHRPDVCPHCLEALPADLAAQVIGHYERIDSPKLAPVVTRHRRLAVVCPHCQGQAKAVAPQVVKGTPFGPRLHA